MVWYSERFEGDGMLNFTNCQNILNSWVNYPYLLHGSCHILHTLNTACDACQWTNCRITTATPELHPVPVKLPWYHVGIDFIGPVTTSDSGNRYILTLSDYCSKWVEAVPTQTKHASGVAHALFKVCMHIYSANCKIQGYWSQKIM